ncbi:MAG4940 family membrane protein [Mycoplasma sp. Mirounga ES2805-ORL]|uniref:MAG4940 family membrane protein n=1 Tax=Mycoplasma sp. Mirounga ES2805-ORL TaxID=754514 RepID=UPI00197BF950|nr:hypothetical protein [Mycoplasma sp. Mirounga ES2805-ORL]QSF13552.1 hypothetical protein JXZ90_02665 [Mycoplasma sp. Mirounga ES2805-ORL]
MNTKQLLEASWNKIGFIYEFLSVFTLIFFSLMWILFAKLLKKQNNKIFIASGFTLATFLMFVLPWAYSFIFAKKQSFALLNPLIVIIQSTLQGFDSVDKTWHPIYKGSGYLIGGQLLGGLLGFVFFVPFYWLIKRLYIDSLEYGEIVREWKIKNILKQDSKANKTWWVFAIKEAIFISLFVSTVPMVNYISTSFYGLNNFTIMLTTLILIWFILFASSFFGFFAFHIVFPLITLILTISTYVFNVIQTTRVKQKDSKKECKLELIEVATSLYQFMVCVFLTIIIPIIFGHVFLLISENTGIILNF